MSRERDLLIRVYDSVGRYIDADLKKEIEDELSKSLNRPAAWMKRHKNGLVVFSLNPADKNEFMPLYEGEFVSIDPEQKRYNIRDR
jgi:hypothetical protein